MTLSEEARDRLADVVALQPTKNGELQERWGLDSGSEVHQYLESELSDYYYRDEDSLICATPEAAELVGAEGPDDGGARTVQGTDLEAAIVDVIAGPDEETQSVVSVVHALEDATGGEFDVDDVRSALGRLVDKGVLDRVQKTVPTFRLAVERDAIDVDVVAN